MTETLKESFPESASSFSINTGTKTILGATDAGISPSKVSSSTAYSGLEVSFESLPVSPYKSSCDISSPEQRLTGFDGNIENTETEYAPSYGSASYALLTTLFKYMQDPSFVGHLDKTQLCQAAQSSCDQSFSVSCDFIGPILDGRYKEKFLNSGQTWAQKMRGIQYQGQSVFLIMPKMNFYYSHYFS